MEVCGSNVPGSVGAGFWVVMECFLVKQCLPASVYPPAVLCVYSLWTRLVGLTAGLFCRGGSPSLGLNPRSGLCGWAAAWTESPRAAG